jgi:hypothetical protein
MAYNREFSQPARYQITVKGSLERTWSEWFDGFTVAPGAGGETMLSGEVADQPALHGLLARIRDLGLPLISVVRVQERES